ncbi:hypothetical protein [Adhaeribacter pallidiroseus]|uniref:Outer membrane protein beta-barrel domain-containing protein n=1 Tax=Adhaeribacter pallidiroseus TaxID=2072847 RepID=A0A369QLW3_9BACT|nr:hypothetical protein [Adhaeribacter pallidiroseus]RDC63238.1 hypothetical protein AHMF7616_01839 [Adhaeribacter pallidiroseus]
MKIQSTQTFVFLSLIWLISACSLISHHSGYDANPVYAPFHEKANELKLSAGYGRVLGIQGNASYSLSNRIAVMAGGVYNHQTIGTIGILDEIYFKIKSHYAEGGIGYYFPVEGKAITQVEIFAGLGSGIINKKTDFDKNFSGSYQEWNSSFQKTFILITAKKPTTDNLDIGFANRLSLIHFDKLQYSSYNDSARNTNLNSLVTEPVLIVNYGKRLKFTSQVGVAIPLTTPFKTTSGTRYANASGIFQIGVKYDLIK